jgi:twitching motility protein PilT
MAQLDNILQMAVKAGASDLHVPTGSPFLLRRFGRLQRMKSQVLTPEVVQGLVHEILTPYQQTLLKKHMQLDFSYQIPGVARFRSSVVQYQIPGVARFRSSVVQQRNGLDATFRVIPFQVPTFEQLGLPAVMEKFCDFHQGMILVTGATGQGKTTTLAAIIDRINTSRPVHILTVEDPIEFVHPLKKGIVNQRELGRNTLSFENALKAALREDPDVIMVGELRDLEAIRLAISASETGHLVLGTLSTSSGPKTVDRLIDSFPADEQNQIRSMLAEGLRAVITQQLIPRADGKGRVLAAEVMIGTVPMANLIRTGKTYQLQNIMQTGRGVGMQLLDDAIMDLLKAGLITAESAAAYAENPKPFQNRQQG